MKVFKFGGASVHNAAAVRNMCAITRDQGQAPLVVVVSAMGKSTNALENLISLKNSPEDLEQALEKFCGFHWDIANDLFDKEHRIFEKLHELCQLLSTTLKADITFYDQFYDSVVCYGELLSTTIIHGYLNQSGVPCKFLDARKLIITDSTFREGKVLWEETRNSLRTCILESKPDIYITQGFIAGNDKGQTLTLGREGSDFTAAILAACLDADSVTIWKDVPGVLNADPQRWPDTIKYPSLSYAEAAEMTYYGATVIHPKTIRPLALKNIPLIVKSFIDPVEEGTRIDELRHVALEPAIIVKADQCLISFQVRDFTFINERKLSMIFNLFEEYNIKVNMMQSSAISFSVCIDSPNKKMKVLINSLRADFDIFYNDHLELTTIKNYRQPLIDRIIQGKQILLEQKSRKNYQMVTSVGSGNLA